MQRAKAFTIKNVENEEFHFKGYASTFENVDRDGDVMKVGCFDKTVQNKPVVPMCYNHNPDNVIGKMELSIDDKGLIAKGTFNLNDPNAQRIYDLVKMGAIDSMSIGFIISEYEPIDAKSPWGAWNIKEVDLCEVSVVTVPSNPKATIDNVKSVVSNEKALERFIADSVRKGVEETLEKIQRKESIINRLNEI